MLFIFERNLLDHLTKILSLKAFSTSAFFHIFLECSSINSRAFLVCFFHFSEPFDWDAFYCAVKLESWMWECGKQATWRRDECLALERKVFKLSNGKLNSNKVLSREWKSPKWIFGWKNRYNDSKNTTTELFKGVRHVLQDVVSSRSTFA